MQHRVERTPVRSEEVLRVDEELLSLGAPSVRIGFFAEGAVSLGVSQREVGLIAERARAAELPVVRRSSGGTSLLHLPGDLFWSVVLPRGHPMAGSGYVHRYAGLGSGWVEFLRRRKVSCRWDAPSLRNEEYCLLSSRGRALVVGDRSLGGASQHVTHRALLHHGVVPATLRPDLLHAIFGLPAETIAHGLTSLQGEGVSVEVNDLPELADAIERGLGEPS